MRDDEMTAALAANLGHNLAALRDLRRLTQHQLATLAGVPRSTVAQLESGAGNPTLAVLARLAAALQLTIEELLSRPRAEVQVVRARDLPRERRGHGGRVEVRLLLPDPIPGMQIDRLELAAGARLPGVPHRAGTREYLACERGRLILATGGERLELGPGDVAAFRGDQPHSYHNPATTPAIAYSVVTLAPVGARRPAPNEGAAEGAAERAARPAQAGGGARARPTRAAETS